MPSSFPSMDPYLEGHLWPDVHQRLASEISRQLMPRITPRYVARLATYVFEDREPEAEIGIMYPDVEAAETGRPNRSSQRAAKQPAEASPAARSQAMTAPLTIPIHVSVPVRITGVEVRDVEHNRLVTAIEILSPVNKRGEGLAQVRRKRDRLARAGVHLLELDLIRRGTRPLADRRIPHVAYLIALTRAGAKVVELWPIALQDRLPTVPVPLLPPDADVPLDLAHVMDAVYDEAAYSLSIDHRRSPPPPDLPEADRAWLRAQVGQG